MTEHDQAAKRHKRQREDRLSSLPDDILIRILSCAPINLAIVTGCLSRRWRGLWTNVTSIDISLHNFMGHRDEFFRVFNKVRKDIVSPFVHTFKVEFWYCDDPRRGSSFLNTWLHHVSDRNVRELKISCSSIHLESCVFSLRSPVFQTRSLVSLELHTTFAWELPDDGADFPNLKNLSISLSANEWGSFEKSIKACPSLEELSIKYWTSPNMNRCIKCSNNNVTRLILDFRYCVSGVVVINTPKLDYLNVHAHRSNNFFFEKEPIALREAKIEINDNPFSLREADCHTSMLQFYRAIGDVRILTLNDYPLHSTATVFSNVTRLTLMMDRNYDVNFVLTVVKLCPLVVFVELHFSDIGENYNSKTPDLSTPLGLIRRIKIETPWYTYDKPGKYFLKLAKHLLGNAGDLEYFRFKVAGQGPIATIGEGNVKRKQKRELNLWKRLNRYRMASIKGCQLEFVGRFLTMSCEAQKSFLTSRSTSANLIR